MENLIIFFCDINGTIDGISKNYYDDYIKFNELLIKLKQSDNADQILFSLVSSENENIVYKKANTINKYLDKSIIMGKHFFENGYIEYNRSTTTIIGKIWQINTYLEELQLKYNINKVYLADDSKIIHEMLTEILEDKNIKTLESIIPDKKNGLNEINSIISNKYIKTKKLILQKKELN